MDFFVVLTQCSMEFLICHYDCGVGAGPLITHEIFCYYYCHECPLRSYATKTQVKKGSWCSWYIFKEHEIRGMEY